MSSSRSSRKKEGQQHSRPLDLAGSGGLVRDRTTPPPKRKAPSRRAAQRAPPTFERQGTSDIYRGLISEAVQPEEESRPLKRRKTAASSKVPAAASTSPASARSIEVPQGRKQTVFNDSDSSGGSDVDWEDIVLQKEDGGQPTRAPQSEEDDANGGISVIIGATFAKATKTQTTRRLPSTAVEKKKRLDVHKMHVCCLLAHVYTRNVWCNDEHVQARVRPLIGARLESYLNPDQSMSQFQRSRSFMDGLQQVSDLWKTTFKITERGLRRPLWAVTQEELAAVCICFSFALGNERVSDFKANTISEKSYRRC